VTAAEYRTSAISSCARLTARSALCPGLTQPRAIRADTKRMTTAFALAPRDVKSFRMAKPVAAELTVCTFLSLAASGVWLFVLPLELLQLIAG
jgi:hypothetical protein